MVFCYWSVYNLIFEGILGLNWISSKPFLWMILLAANLIQAVLGLLFCYVGVSAYIFSGSSETRDKGDEILFRIAGWQGKWGVAGLLVGSGVIVLTLFQAV